MMGEGGKDSYNTACSERVVVEEEVLGEQSVGFEAGVRTGEAGVGVSEGGEVGRSGDGSVGIWMKGVGDLEVRGSEEVCGEGNEVVCVEEKDAKEVKERVVEDKDAEEVKERVVEEKDAEEVKERVVEEKYAEVVNEMVVEEKDAEEGKERVVEEKTKEEVKESVVGEKAKEEVNERVVEEKDAGEVKERVDGDVQERFVEEQVAEEVKERFWEEVMDTGGVDVDDATKPDEGVIGVEHRNEENVAEGSGGIDQTVSAGQHIEVAKDTMLDSGKVGGEDKMRGPEMVGSDAAVSVNDEKIEKVVTDNGASSMVNVASVMEGTKDMEYLEEKSMERELVGSKNDDWDNLKANKVFASDTEVQCHGPGTADASANLQNVNVQTPAIEATSVVVVNKEVLDPNNHTVASDALEGCAFSSDKLGSSGEETNCIEMTKDGETSMQPIIENDQVIVDGIVVKTTEGKSPCATDEKDSSAGEKMDIDERVTQAGQLSHDHLENKRDEEQLKLATNDVDDSQSGDMTVSCPQSLAVDESDVTVMHDPGLDAKAMNSSCSGYGGTSKVEAESEGKTADTQIIDSGGSLMETDEKFNTNSGISALSSEDWLLMSKECLNNHAFGHVSQIDSLGHGLEVQKQVTENYQVAWGAGEEIKSKLGENGLAQGGATAFQPTKVAEEVVESENNNIDVPMHVDTEGMPLCQGYNQKLGTEIMDRNTKSDTEVVTKENATLVNGQQVLDSATSAPGSKEAKEQSKSGTWLDSCIAHGTQSESSKLQETVVEKQTNDTKQLGLREEQKTVVGEAVNDAAVLHGEQEMAIELAADAEPQENVRLVAVRPGSSVRVHQACYLLPMEDKEKLSISNLVWGKVRSHPWWPGQIFDISDSSEQAMKHHKKDCFLVAYFGDRTFAWNDASQLKPFGQHFSQIEKHTNSESFQNAVSCALEEISRRVEFGLACSCMSKDDYEKIKVQRVENAGVCRESSIRVDEDKSLGVDIFEPSKLLKYTKALARLPSGGADRLELEIAKAQLLSFNRLKGYSQLPEVQICGDMQLDQVNGQEIPDTEDEKLSSLETGKKHSGSYHRRKHNLREGLYHKKKQRNGSELISDTLDSQDDDSLSKGKVVGKTAHSYTGRKRKASEPIANNSDVLDGKKTTSLLKVSQSPAPVPSFKIGNRICRVANQLTGPPLVKNNAERPQKIDGSSNEPTGDDFDVFVQNSEEANGERVKAQGEYTSLDDLLSQLHLTARNPLKEQSSLNIIVSFFSDFRNSVMPEQPVAIEEICRRKKKSSFPVGDPETFDFEVEDVKDSYWTDRVIENGSEEEPSERKRKRDPAIPVELAKSPRTNKRPYSKKRNSSGASKDGASKVATEKTTVHIREKKQDLSPTELLMFFPGVASIPSEKNLNRTFGRFGSLWESETEIDEETNRARVIFKKCSDAEVAYNSAGRFNIFGATSVNYQLNYTPTIPFKTSPPITTEGQENAI